MKKCRCVRFPSRIKRLPMQITSSGAKAQTYTSIVESTKSSLQSNAAPRDMPTYATSINENASDYIKLDMDLRAFTKIDPVQEQTNRELYAYLLKIMDEDTSNQKPWNGFHNTEMNVSIAGKKENFTAFQAELFFNRAFAFEEHAKNLDPNYLREVSNKMFQDMLEYKRQGLSKEITVATNSATGKNILHPWEIELPKNAQILDGFSTLSKEDARKKGVETLINIYNLSDEFIQSGMFEDFLNEYKEKKSAIIDAAHAEGKSYDAYLQNGLEEFLLNDIAGQARSKSEIIEHYSSISNDLRELIQHYEDTPHMNLSKGVLEDMSKSINLYERMVKDLKEMWGFGGFDLHV